MIQDIEPHRLDNSFDYYAVPDKDSILIHFTRDGLLYGTRLPRLTDLVKIPDKLIYILKLDDTKVFLALDETLEYKDGVQFNPLIKIGNGVTIGQNAHIFCASGITIGDNVGIGGNVMINDCAHGYADLDAPIQDQPISTKPIEIGENTLIGNNVLILPGVKIGRNCCIGGNVVIAKSVPDYSVVSAPRPRAVVMPH